MQSGGRQTRHSTSLETLACSLAEAKWQQSSGTWQRPEQLRDRPARLTAAALWPLAWLSCRRLPRLARRRDVPPRLPRHFCQGAGEGRGSRVTSDESASHRSGLCLSSGVCSLLGSLCASLALRSGCLAPPSLHVPPRPTATLSRVVVHSALSTTPHSTDHAQPPPGPRARDSILI